MLCANCGKEKGIKVLDNELLCEHCYTIKQAAKIIALIAWKNAYYYGDRQKIEKIVESIYDKGFDDGYKQSMYEDYGMEED